VVGVEPLARGEALPRRARRCEPRAEPLPATNLVGVDAEPRGERVAAEPLAFAQHLHGIAEVLSADAVVDREGFHETLSGDGIAVSDAYGGRTRVCANGVLVQAESCSEPVGPVVVQRRAQQTLDDLHGLRAARRRWTASTSDWRASRSSRSLSPSLPLRSTTAH
jgi:hypothetical protein